MEFDISKILNQAYRKIAEDIDATSSDAKTKGNKKLDGGEISIFLNKVNEQEGTSYSEGDIGILLGFESGPLKAQTSFETLKLYDDKYLKTLQSYVDQILTGTSRINANHFKNGNEITKDLYAQIDDKTKALVDYIIELDGDPKTISKQELMAILVLFDASHNGKLYEVDGNLEISDKTNYKNGMKDQVEKIYNYFVGRSNNNELDITLPTKYSAERLESLERTMWNGYDTNIVELNEYNAITNAQKFAKTLEKYKTELMSDLNLTSDEYDNLANLALGIAEQETHFQQVIYQDTKGELHRQNRLLLKMAGELLDQIEGAVTGTNGDNVMSVGVTQLRYSTIANDSIAKEICEKYGITSREDYRNDPEKAAIATLIVLRQKQKIAQGERWQNRLRENNAKIEDPNLQITTDDITALLWNGTKIAPKFDDPNYIVTINEKNTGVDSEGEPIKDGATYAKLVRAYRQNFFGGNTTTY